MLIFRRSFETARAICEFGVDSEEQSFHLQIESFNAGFIDKIESVKTIYNKMSAVGLAECEESANHCQRNQLLEEQGDDTEPFVS